MKPNESLIQAAKLFEERGEVYKDNYRRAGEVFMWLFADGINIDSAETYNRMAILMQIINKLLRYTLNFEEGHLDSLQDMAVYTMILKELDEEYLNDNE